MPCEVLDVLRVRSPGEQDRDAAMPQIVPAYVRQPRAPNFLLADLRLVGAGGNDEIFGDEGNDRINVQEGDNFPDTVNCGPGKKDRVFFDKGIDLPIFKDEGDFERESEIRLLRVLRAEGEVSSLPLRRMTVTPEPLLSFACTGREPPLSLGTGAGGGHEHSRRPGCPARCP